jgi:hypothetical protein
MHSQTVAENLRNTIAGKEQYLVAVINGLQSAKGVDRVVLKTTKAMLELDINELKRILQDVEQCQEFDKQKFAELIVKECMEQVWYTREDSINGNVSQVIKDRIKEHFGVE